MHVPSSCRLALATFGLLAICPSVRGENAALPKPKEFAILRGHTNAAWGLDLTPDALTVVSGNFDKTIKI